MTPMISLIIIYLILNNLYFYNKERKKDLGISSLSDFLKSILILIFFVGFFVIFIRVLSFFRANSSIDLKFFFQNYNIVLIFLIIFFFLSLRRFIFFYTKISFFKLHYFYLAPCNNEYHIYYYKFYILGVYNFCVKIYDFLYFIDKAMLFLLILFFCRDIFFFDFILGDVLLFLKYYSFFKLFYILVRFVAVKQQLMLDYYLFNLYYLEGVSIDEGFFAETLSKNVHKMDDYEKNILKV